jgi:hypothetical protein
MLDDGNCRVAQDTSSSAGPNDSRRPTGDTVIQKSVGQGGSNQFDDVFKIQYSLDKIAPIDGGPSPQLVVDGKCGPKTVGAIRDFQKKHFGWAGCDGRIDPGKQTLKKINELQNHNIFPHLPLSLTTDAWLLADLLKHIPFTRNCIAAAQRNIREAMASMGAPGLGSIGNDKMKLSERHFLISAHGVKMRTILQKIHDIYGNMQQVLDRATEFFTLDTTDEGETISTVAFARLGGFFDKRDTTGRIKLRRGAYFATLSQDFAAFVFIHEMRHFVDQEQKVGHFGKGWYTDPGMLALSPDDRAANCDTFAGFALEAQNGDMQRPGWLKSTQFR